MRPRGARYSPCMASAPVMLAVPNDRPLVIDDRGAQTRMRASEAATGRSLFSALAGRTTGRVDPHMDAIERHLWAVVAVQDPARTRARFDVEGADAVLLLQVDERLRSLPASPAREEGLTAVRRGQTLRAIEALSEADAIQWATDHGTELPEADDLVRLVGDHLGHPLPEVRIRVVAHEILNSAAVVWRRGVEAHSCEGMYRPGKALVIVSDRGEQALHVIHELIHVGQGFPEDWLSLPSATARLGLAEGLAVSISADITHRRQRVNGAYCALAWMTTALLPGMHDRTLFNHLGVLGGLEALSRAYDIDERTLATTIDQVWGIDDGDPLRVARVLADAGLGTAAGRIPLLLGDA